jgi:2-oxoglutarate ferredoxin oxidoreductase subunit alpha
MALFGRHAESPLPVVAAATPGDCFWMAFEAARIALTYMTPVVYLTDGYLANGTEPFRIPRIDDLPEIPVRFARPGGDGEPFLPYGRDPQTLARSWAVPGTPSLEHRIGGLEKADGTGEVSYDPQNHAHMIRIRAEKVARVGDGIPPLEVFGPETGDLLVVGWGGTFGAIRGAVRRAQEEGHSVAQVHLRHLNPLPSDLEGILSRYRGVLVPELNTGQLLLLLRGKYLVDAVGLNKIDGRPFATEEILEGIVGRLEGKTS